MCCRCNKKGSPEANAFGLGFLLTECIRRGGIQDLPFARQRACLRRHTCFWLVRKGTVSTPLSFSYEKESVVDGRKKESSRGICVGTSSTSLILSAACGGQASSVPLFLLFPHESLRWIRVGALAPLQTPLKRPRKRRFLFLGTITPPNIGDGGIPYVKYSTGANGTTRTEYCALGKPNQTARPKGVPCGMRFR